MADPEQLQLELARSLVMPKPMAKKKRSVRIIGFPEDKPIYVAFAPTMQIAKHRHVKGSYEAFGASGLSLYKSAETAQRFNHSHRHVVRGNDHPDRVNALVTILRPDELEPVNVTPDERVEFYKEQIGKWTDRLFTSGLSHDELAVVAEEFMLALGNRMKAALQGDSI